MFYFFVLCLDLTHNRRTQRGMVECLFPCTVGSKQDFKIVSRSTVLNVLNDKNKKDELRQNKEKPSV